MDIAAFKAAQRRMWEDGDYRPIGRLLDPAARILVDRARITAGQRVLDVATGSGSVAVAAATAGADVVGVDITGAWFGEARRRAHAAGVDTQLLIGDAEALPVRSGSLDAVLSSFGAIFAPRHEIMAGELIRVCRPGGTIGLTAWTPDGASNMVVSTLTRDLPPPPSFVTPSIEWGRPAHTRQVLSAHGADVVFARPSFVIELDSVDAFESLLLDNSGGFDDLRRALDEAGRWDQVRADFHRAAERANEADDGSYRVTWDFLLIIAHKPG